MPYDVSTPEGIQKAKDSRKRWYEKNKARHQAGVKKVKREKTAWLAEFKSSLACERCPENHPACLDFHHKDGSKKEYNIAWMAHRGFSLERIQQEINKCIVLCSNCHRKLHHEERRGSLV